MPKSHEGIAAHLVSRDEIVMPVLIRITGQITDKKFDDFGQ
ncbi:hypothetical protein X971_4914 (plasmid) [Agrobacterium tumefaciens LBA4213 (Ach5)]|nr:hypothetical protein X971_4914 [Agrobacterium tumefaciens LBA4213 (Ach5)]